LSEDQDIRQLLREGVEAARAGDKATARDRFEQVTELDESNEQAWFRLAAVVESDDERRVCLENVLHINPENERARQILDRLDARRQEASAGEEIIPGVPRRQFMLIAGGGGLAVVVLIVVILMLVISNGNRDAANQAATQAVLDSTTMAIAQTTDAAATQAAQEVIPTATRVSELPTEIPATETATATPAEVGLPPPPGDVRGRIVAWGGRDVLSNGALEPRLYQLQNSGEFSLISDDLGRDVRFAGSPDRVVYTRYFPSTFDFGLEAVNVNGTQVQFIQTLSMAIKAEQPDACSVANRVVFTGVPQGAAIDLSFDTETARQVFIIDLDVAAENTEGGSGIIQITNDDATYNYPTFSSDCSRVAVVRDDANSANAGADIYIIDVATRTLSAVTTDLTTFVETTPRWSPDGTQVIFAAASANDPANHDIVLVNADGSGVPSVLARTPADDILPVISPDGQYLAYSSNQENVYNIYISPLFDEQVWQLTNADDDVFVGGWMQDN
jgi:hypothetical protein